MEKKKRPFNQLLLFDYLRFGKSFQLRVGLNERQCLDAIRSIQGNYQGNLYRVKIDETIRPYQFQITQETIKGTKWAALEGEIRSDANIEITTISGKVYANAVTCLTVLFSLIFFAPFMLLIANDSLHQGLYVLAFAFLIFFMLILIYMPLVPWWSRTELYQRLLKALQQ